MSAPHGGTLARTTSLAAGILRYWLPVVVYVSVIFAVSSVANLAPPVRWSNADKLAHLSEYTALGFLLARAFDGTAVMSSRIANMLLAMITGLLTGTLDELWQIHVPGRVSSHMDFLADATGILIGQLLYSLWARRPGR